MIIKCPFCLGKICVEARNSCFCGGCTYLGIAKGLPCPQGLRGEKGDPGLPGKQGEKGEQGDSAINFTTSHMSATHTGGITLDVVKSGVNIPLTGAKVLNGFTPNASFDSFIVGTSGNYLLMYNIKMRDNTTVKTRVIRNDTLLSGTVRSTSVPTSNFSLSIILPLQQGDAISLQLFDLDTQITLQGGTGASLVLIRLL